MVDDGTHLMALFHDSMGKPVPECRHSGFTEAKDDGGGGDNCSYRHAKLQPNLHRQTNPSFLQA